VTVVAAADAPQVELFESYRRELTAYCYRMLASPHDAEDAVQDTFVRAWRGLAGFEGRAGLRPWLYRIATNVCLDGLKSRGRRALPMDVALVATGELVLGPARPEATWVQPVPDGLVTPADGDPAEIAVWRESIRLAFVAALQHLLPRQRAVLILRDVLRWRADEVAELLDTTVQAVHSMLRRARSALAEARLDGGRAEGVAADQELLARYVEAFERFDVDALVTLLHDDATLAMPPHDLWLRGRADIRRWLLDNEAECAHERLVPVAANGSPAVAMYRPGPWGTPEPFAIHVLDVSGGGIAGIHAFLDPSLFPVFGLELTP
jgi:RNA polymerase sigma-70 factor (ECF subfamily)